MDLEALVTDELRDELRSYTLEWFDVEASSRRPPHATVELRTPDGETVRGDFTGDGPVDAIFRAINAATQREARLREFRIDSVTGGQDALGEASVVLEVAGQSAGGQGVSTDIIEAAALAYVRALSNAERRVAAAADGRRGRAADPQLTPTPVGAMATWDELRALRPGAARPRPGRGVRDRADDPLRARTAASGSSTGSRATARAARCGSRSPRTADDAVIAYDSSATLELRARRRPGDRARRRAAAAADERPGDLPQRGALGGAQDGASSSTTSTRKGDRRVTYECRRRRAVWEVSEGRAIDAAGVEILA